MIKTFTLPIFGKERGTGIAPHKQFPQYESAIKRRNASFNQLVDVLYGVDGGKDRETYLSYCPHIYNAFERANGGILRIYRCERAKAAAVLTEREVFTYYSFTAEAKSDNFSKAKRLLIQCDRLAIEVRRFLTGRELRTCSELIYSAAFNLLRCIDCPHEDPNDITQTLELVEGQIKFAKQYHKNALPLACQRYYFLGMIQGLLPLIVAIGVIGWLLSLVMLRGLESDLLVASLIGGGLGAIVSIMWRMNSDNLDLKTAVGPNALKRAGAFRPIIGAIFGAAIFALMGSGLISIIKIPTAGPKELLFYSAIGFIAGFSERWAPDMIAAAEGIMATSSLDEESVSEADATQPKVTP